MTITVRQGTPADFQSIVDHYGSPDLPWDPFGSLEGLKAIPLEGLLIGEVDKEYAGFCYWFIGETPWFDPDTKRFAYITEVHVRKAYQGQGVGKRLLTCAVDNLRKRENPGKIYISTSETNVVARHLYESIGFQPFARSIHYKLE